MKLFYEIFGEARLIRWVHDDVALFAKWIKDQRWLAEKSIHTSRKKKKKNEQTESAESVD